MENGTVTSPSGSAPSVLYKQILAVTALLATVTNLLVLAVFLSSKRLLKSSSLLIGLTIAHVFNGLTHSLNAFWPATYADISVSPIFCVKAVWPLLYVATYQLLPVVLALAGVERLLALVTPMWYRIACTHRRQWYVTAAAFLYALIIMGIDVTMGWINSGQVIPATCSPPTVIGPRFMVYGVHLPAVLGGVCATVCTAIGLYVGRRKIRSLPSKSHGEIARVKKQIRLAKCLLMISCIDVICVVIPNFILVLYNAGLWVFPLRYATLAVIVYCSDSIWNIVAFLLFNHEFRKVMIKFFTCRKGVSVGPSAIEGTAAIGVTKR